VVVIKVRNAELMETVAKEAKRLDIPNGAIPGVGVDVGRSIPGG
jgi:hypothetical protein